MKRTLDEILSAVNSIVGEENTDDAVINLIEDLTDTINAAPEADDTSAAEVERLTKELADFKRRYKERFLGRVPEDEQETDDEEEIEAEDETPDAEKITVKDIFKKKED